MGFLSRLLSSLLLLIALPTYAYVPDQLDAGYLNLNQTQKFLIRNGHVVPYNKQFVRRVVVGKAKIRPNGAIINLPHGPDMVPSYHDLKHNPVWQHKEKEALWKDLKFIEEHNKYDAKFLLVHAVDIYSTYKGLKYSCVSEANPIVGEHPSLAKLKLFKVGIISLLEAMYGGHPYEWQAFQTVSSYTTGVVVVNNFKVIREARNNPRCIKR